MLLMFGVCKQISVAVCAAALTSLLLEGNSKAATQQLADLSEELQHSEPRNAQRMLQLVS